VAAHGGASGRVQAHASERELGARGRREAEELALPDQARLLLSLQQAAGNQAVSNLLHRKVRIAPSTGWATRTGQHALPQMPARFLAQYQPNVIDQVNALAAKWRDDDVEGTFASADDFYRKLFNHVVIRGTAAVAPTNYGCWKVLGDAVAAEGNLTEVKWSNLNATEAGKLLNELQQCQVQISGNVSTTACHANAHGKLPKRVAGPNGELVSDLPARDQPRYTPYIEFLITGHKTENGIERGILDRVSGLVYVTAHYDVGSIAWLSGVPGALVSNWSRKAKDYTRLLRK
jgi:hypothetical protein